MNQTVAKRMLEKLGYAVTLAVMGAQAVVGACRSRSNGQAV